MTETKVRIAGKFAKANYFSLPDQILPVVSVKHTVSEEQDILPLCLLETAFVFNKPVIATNVGAFAEIINDKNGRLVNDVETLPDAIIDVMNQEINVTMDACYSWPHIKKEYLKLYNSLKGNEANVN